MNIDGHTSCLVLAGSSVELRGTACLDGSRRPDWREVEARERTAWESLVTGGVMRDMVMEEGLGGLREER